jgi:hypothetical protein
MTHENGLLAKYRIYEKTCRFLLVCWMFRHGGFRFLSTIIIVKLCLGCSSVLPEVLSNVKLYKSRSFGFCEEYFKSRDPPLTNLNSIYIDAKHTRYHEEK